MAKRLFFLIFTGFLYADTELNVEPIQQEKIQKLAYFGIKAIFGLSLEEEKKTLPPFKIKEHCESQQENPLSKPLEN